MLVFAMTMSTPGSYGSANNDGVDVRRHCVFHVGWYKQEGTYGIGREVIQVQIFPEADFQYTLDDRDSGI